MSVTIVISLNVDDNLGNVSIDINMEINNWYQTPNQIEFSTYGDGIMGDMEKQMQLKQMIACHSNGGIFPHPQGQQKYNCAQREHN